MSSDFVMAGLKHNFIVIFGVDIMNNHNHRKTVGDRINTLLAEQDKSQKSLANKLGVKPNVISYFCKGTRTPNTEQLCIIADFFNVSTDYLLGRSNAQTTDELEREICDYLGLSEKALRAIFGLNLTSQMIYSNKKGLGLIGALNYLLENHSESFCIDLFGLATESQLVFTDNEDKKIPVDKRNWKETTHDEYCNLIRYRLSEKFTRMLDEFDRRSIDKAEYTKLMYGALDNE